MQNKKILNRLKKIRGQVDGVIKMIEDDKYCLDISNQIIAVNSALKSANREIISNHLKSCVKNSLETKDENDLTQKIEEIEELILKLGK